MDETTAVLGQTRGWKPPAIHLSTKQEQAIEEATNAMRKKPGRCAWLTWSVRSERFAGCFESPALPARP
ncbi:MAG: hypothetical protein ABI537_14465 [Casimicrobiaceae bacterium]